VRLAWVAVLAAAAPLVAAPEVPADARHVDGVAIHIALVDGDFAQGGQPIRTWIERSAHIVSDYYGTFPVHELWISVEPANGVRVGGGTTYGQPRPHIRLRVGRDVTDLALRSDWVLVHEMTHLALPDVGPEHAWLSEGLATYVEGVERVQAGNRAETDVWAEAVRSMPHGLPQAGDEGLDHTHTWGRTYWGGALFCLLADVGIRKRTANGKGFEDAMRAINRAGGTIDADWPIERAFEIGDKATDGKTLVELYEKMRSAPVMVDLPDLWKQLGVERRGRTVEFDEHAPLAAIRKSIISG
jgi:hypothetical protein